MKLGRGNKKFWGRSGLFPVHGPEIFVVQKGQFHGPKFFILRQLRNQKKRQKTGLSNTSHVATATLHKACGKHVSPSQAARTCAQEMHKVLRAIVAQLKWMCVQMSSVSK